MIGRFIDRLLDIITDENGDLSSSRFATIVIAFVYVYIVIGRLSPEYLTPTAWLLGGLAGVNQANRVMGTIKNGNGPKIK